MENTAPEVDQTPRPRRRVPRYLKAAAVGTLALGVFRFDGCDWFENSGELRSADPPPELVREEVDGQFNVVTWNVRGQILEHLDEIREIATTRQTDVFSFQEVLEKDFERLAGEFTPEGWSLRYVVADSNAKLIDGALGNLLMTRVKPTAVETYTIGGSSASESVLGTAEGVRAALRGVPSGKFDLNQAKDAKQEDRAVIIEQVTAWDADTGEERPVMAVGTHISGNSLTHDEQWARLLEILAEVKDDSVPLVLLADLNTYREQVRNDLLRLGMDASLTDEEISLKGTRQVDYIGVYPADMLGVAEVQPLSDIYPGPDVTDDELAELMEEGVDHYPLEARFSTDSAYE